MPPSASQRRSDRPPPGDRIAERIGRRAARLDCLRRLRGDRHHEPASRRGQPRVTRPAVGSSPAAPTAAAPRSAAHRRRAAPGATSPAARRGARPAPPSGAVLDRPPRAPSSRRPARGRRSLLVALGPSAPCPAAAVAIRTALDDQRRAGARTARIGGRRRGPRRIAVRGRAGSGPRRRRPAVGVDRPAIGVRPSRQPEVLAGPGPRDRPTSPDVDRPVPRRRHAPQAGRRRHDRRGRQAACCGRYKVQSGDTLTGIARKFGVSMMTLWWANNLKSKDDLHIGQVLDDPAGQRPRRHGQGRATRSRRSPRKYKVEPDRDRRGQRARRPEPRHRPGADPCPGARGQADRDAEARTPAVRGHRQPPTTSRPTTRSASRTSKPPARYTGGAFAWPVAGGYISQYFHYGHYGDRHRRRLRDAGQGRGRRDGDLRRLEEQRRRLPGLDLPRVRPVHDVQPHVVGLGRARRSASAAASRSAGSGRAGNATGPHLHFEVWRGPIWNGGTRVNPLAYL